MPTLEIVRAWKDEEYRDTLSAEQQDQLPRHPAGLIEFQEGTVEAGGTFWPAPFGYNKTLITKCITIHCRPFP
jgi:mersacidin/lichenicidin family type 2 lantibiotic